MPQIDFETILHFGFPHKFHDLIVSSKPPESTIRSLFGRKTEVTASLCSPINLCLEESYKSHKQTDLSLLPDITNSSYLEIQTDNVGESCNPST